MKFAKELEEDLVPEWRDKYLDYKQGKKKIKAVSRALRNLHSPSPAQTWKAPGNRRPSTLKQLPEDSVTEFSPPEGSHHDDDDQQEHDPAALDGSRTGSQPIQVPARAKRKDDPDQDNDDMVSEGGTRWRRYGSIIGSPPTPDMSRPTSLNLGDPAIETASDEELLQEGSQHRRTRTADGTSDTKPKKGSVPGESPSAFEVGRTRSPARRKRPFGNRHASDPGHVSRARHGAGSKHAGIPFKERFSAKHRHMRYIDPTKAPDFHPNREDPLFKRMFSRHGTKPLIPADVPMEAWKEVDLKQDDFWDFLDTQLEKVETFYKQKEDEATSRLNTLKRQLHVLRDHRQQEVDERRAALRERKKKQRENGEAEDEEHLSAVGSPASSDEMRHAMGIHNLPNKRDALHHPIESAKQVKFRGLPKVLGSATPPTKTLEQMRDYTRKPEHEDHSYPGAKRKLKRALQEFYRGLELLKSYALLNRTAFRKINKKYDKTVHPRETMAYYEKVNQAWFVKSGNIDEYINSVEDLYARYFYAANRKVASSKLRRKNRLPAAFTQSVFRNGLALGLGACFSIEAVVKASKEYYSNTTYDASGRWIDTPESATTSYVMQLYAGYFLLLLLMMFFCIDCRIFHRAKVNYVFIFEFDTRHNLDWRQLSELPCLFFFLMGLIMWLNFKHVGGETFFIWWPLVLLCLTLSIMFLPLPTVYHESRKWFIQSLGRLLVPVLPVEFRDFFLGDMMCSETYAFGGIELLFCLYVNQFVDPERCNSSNSKLFGFLQTLPGIIRLLQCFRRYWDTKQAFPHLANAGKYTCTILQYMSLSLFRIYGGGSLRAFFIACGIMNGIATSVWDLFIDWSLMDPYAKPRFLRTRLAYKTKWWYYAAILVDPLLRFNWIFYAIPYFSDELQHNSLLGFFVSLSEVFRRGIWTIFRVENEHCTNVSKFKASRDTELPYALTQQEEEQEEEHIRRSTGSEPRRPSHSTEYAQDSHIRYTNSPKPMSPSSELDKSTATGADLEGGRPATSPALSSLRRRQQQGMTPSMPSPGQGLASRVGTYLQGAHAQDFERKRKSPGLDGNSQSQMQRGEQDDDDSDEVATELEAEAEATEEENATGARSRARRALSGFGQSQSQPKKDYSTSNQRDISAAEEALRNARDERSSGDESDAHNSD